MSKFNLTKRRLENYGGYEVARLNKGLEDVNVAPLLYGFDLSDPGYYVIYDHECKSLHISFVANQYGSGFDLPTGFKSTIYNIRKGRTKPTQELKEIAQRRTLVVYYIHYEDMFKLVCDFLKEKHGTNLDMFKPNQLNPWLIIRRLEQKMHSQNYSDLMLIIKRMFSFKTQN